ncbi:MAG: hypothetical protein JNL08_19785 [Planctomycetes bacterium]|nr:hypothetical protein [Planctomycetota bacterium]
MPDRAAAPFPFDALREGVAAVAGDGAFAPQNDCMRRLLAAWTPTDAERRQLAAGHALRIAVDGREHVLRRAGDWLLAMPADAVDDRAVAAQFAAARARQLGSMASSIAHDLANVLNAAMGFAALADATTQDPAERRLIGELQRGATRGAALARALARMLQGRARERAAVAVGDLIDGVCALATRAAQGRKIALAVAPATGLPPVRVVAAEAQQALLLGLGALLDTAPQRIDIAATAERRAVAGGRERACVCVRLAASGCTAPVGAGASDPDWQTTTSLLLAHAGGEFARRDDGTAATLDYAWPAAPSA